MKFTLFLSLLSLSSLWDLSIAVLLNNTYDDSSPAIVYQPASHWFLDGSSACLQCPNPDMAMNHTYHFGTHFVPPDADDGPADTAVTSSTTQDPDAGPNDDANGQPDGDEHNGGDNGGMDGGGKGKGKGGGKRNFRRRLQRRDDSDDPGFVDTPVNATLTFNGTGVYVYCIIPVQRGNDPTNPFVTNMTFTLDGVAKNFTQTYPTSATPQFSFSQLVFSSSNLTNEEHTLVIRPLLGSMIMLDSINITADSSDISSQNNTSPTTSSSKKPTKKDVETFAIAIGSTTGVLAVLSFIVAANIYTRRRRSAKREKSREAQEESLRPEMRGPQPFVPRYFPGTTITSQSRSQSQLQSSNVSASLAVDSSVSRRSSQSSLGPSHGLNYPLAPEIPSYSSVAPSITEIRPPLPISIALRAPVVRLLDNDDDVVPPSYQEVGQTALLSSPVFGTQPAPSFTELPSPTRHPLILSSSEVASLEDDPETETETETEPITHLASRLSGIPLIIEDDSDATTPERTASSISLHRTRSNTGDGPPR